MPSALDTVIAVPVRNEAERIVACLRAIDAQTGLAPGRLGLVLFLNNCSDGTPDIVADLLPRLTLPVRVIERTYAGAHAGWARRAAMDAAAAWLDEVGASGTLLTTDADSRVPPDWVAANLAALDAGADAVAGRVELIPEEAALLPPSLPARGRLEDAYDALITEMEARIDPDPSDPWPCHRTTIGASLAVRRSAYGAVGGMPEIPLGEDGAFVAALLEQGFRVRHDRAVMVWISARLTGRAAGGVADTIRSRCEEPDALCDARMEAVPPRAAPLRLARAPAPPARAGPVGPRSRLGAPPRHPRCGGPPHRRPAAGRRDRRRGGPRQPAPRLSPADAAPAARPDPPRPSRPAGAATGAAAAPRDPGPPAGRNGALGHRRRLNARFRKDTSFRGSRAEPWLWRETGALPRYPGKGMIPLRSRIYASSRVSPKIGSKAARRAMSTSGRLTMRPRSARLVTPCSRTPQGTMPENATGPARR